MDILMVYNVILRRPTFNTIKAVVVSCLFLVQFELDHEKGGKPYENHKTIREWYYMSLKSLGKRKKPFPGEKSCQNKVGRKVAIEVKEVLSASAEEHGRPPRTNFWGGSRPLGAWMCSKNAQG